MLEASYLGGRNSPNLVVVRAHENIGNALTAVAENPLVEVLGLGVGDAALEGSVNKAVHAFDLVLLWQHGDVVLEGVGYPKALVTDIGDTLVGEPVTVLG